MLAAYGGNTARGIERINAPIIESQKRYERQLKVLEEQTREFERRVAALAARRHAMEKEERRLREEINIAKVQNEHLAVELAKENAFTRRHARKKRRVTFQSLEMLTCNLFRLRKSDLHSARRSQQLVFARQFLIYWARRRTSLSYPQIGRLLGGRDHTTCLWAAKAYRDKRAKMGRYLREVR